MSKRSAIVKKLPSVETLGSVSVICSDKTGALSFPFFPFSSLSNTADHPALPTGTLTTNLMTVTKAYTVDQGIFDIDHSPPLLALSDSRAKVFLVGNLCNHSHLDKGKYHGQATEVALMNVLKDVGMADQRQVRFPSSLPFSGLHPSSPTPLRPISELMHLPLKLSQFFTRKSEVAFTSDSKSQSVTGIFTSTSSAPSSLSNPETTYLSGALEPVLARCKTYLRNDNSLAPLDAGVVKIITAKVHELSSQGLRVVAMAFGPTGGPGGGGEQSADALTFAGFQGMMDPPRPGVADAIAQLSSGGIHVVMITGDSEQTAVAIARQLGIRTTGSGGGAGGRQGVLTGKEIDLLSQRQLTERIGGVTVFARTTPRHKMAIIEAYQSRGAVVAMTGDGGAARNLPLLSPLERSN